MKLYVANRQAGDFIEEVKTVQEGLDLIWRYEAADKEDGTYEEDFYDLVDEDHCAVSIAAMLTAERVKAARTKTGLSMRAFGEKFNIPMRTIQDWERAERKAPEYVVDMLEHEVALEDVVPMMYVLYIYRDGAGFGTMETFTSEIDAVGTAKLEWEHMSESDRDSYKNDANGEFVVALVPAEWDEVNCEYIPDMSSYDPIWSAF